MVTNKKFYLFLLIILVCFTNNVSAQFVPFQSGQFKRLAADTLYDFTGCDTPTVTPNSYKRVVRYYDSCNHLNWHWQPELQDWAVSDGSGGAETWEDVLNNQGAIPFSSTHNTDLGNNNFTLSKANIFTISSDDNVNPYSSFQIAPTYNNLISSGDTTEASALIQNNNTPATTNAQLQASNVASGKSHIVRANVDSILIQGSIAGVPSTDLRVRGLPYDGDTSSVKPIVIDANGRVYRSNWLGDGTIGIRDTAKLVQGPFIYINNADSTYQPNKPDVQIAVDTAGLHNYFDQFYINYQIDTSQVDFIVYEIDATPNFSLPDGTKVLVAHSGTTGDFIGHEDDVATLVGGVYTYQDASSGNQLLVSTTQAAYQFNSILWNQISYAWLGGGNLLGIPLSGGTRDAQPVTLKTKDITALTIDTLQNVAINKFIGTRPGNYLKIDSATGNADTGYFSPLGEGTNITFTYSGDSTYINSTGGSGGTTADETQTATASQTAFTFTDVPADFEDYIMFVWGVAATPTTDYTTSGDVVTFTTGLTEGSLVRFKRIK